MSTYGLYRKARDAAWRALLQLPDKRLPVNVDALAERVGAQVHPFSAAEGEKLLSGCLARCGKGVAVSLCVKNEWHIFVRETDEAHRRFAVAHELGHLLLSHPTVSLAPEVRRFDSTENRGDVMDDPQDPADYEADIFASRFLAPACLLHELGVDTPGGISALCGLPPHAAALRAERMELLNQRNAFFAHRLERQVRDRFRPFLNANRIPPPSPPVSNPAPAGAPKRVVPFVLPDNVLPDKKPAPVPEARTAPEAPASCKPRRSLTLFLRMHNLFYPAILLVLLTLVLVCRIFFR